MKIQTESGRTLTIRINHRSIVLERSAKYTRGRGGGGVLNRFYAKKKLALGSAVVQKNKNIQAIRSAWKTSNSSMHQNNTYINQDPTTLSWNKMRTQQQDPYWNAGATDIQQLNSNGHDQRQNIEPQPTVLKMFRPEPSFRLRHDPSACN